MTYELDYGVSIQASVQASADLACASNDFSFDGASPVTLMSRRVVVPFPAGCTSQTLMVRALEDVDGLDETLAFSLVDGTGYTVTSVSTETSRTLTVTDNEPVVTLLPLRDPSPDISVEGEVAELNRLAVDALLPEYVSGTVTVNVTVTGTIDDGDVTPEIGTEVASLTQLTTLVINGTRSLDIDGDGETTPASVEQLFFAVPDNLEEPEETATVTLLPGNGYRLPATDVSRSVTILDSLSVTIPDTAPRTAVEGGGDDAVARVTLELNRPMRPDLQEFAVASVRIRLPTSEKGFEDSEYDVGLAEGSTVKFIPLPTDRDPPIDNFYTVAVPDRGGQCAKRHDHHHRE